MLPHSMDCIACGARYLPARLRCHRCGGVAFERRPIPDAVVRLVTRVLRVPAGCPYAWLVDLHADGGLPVVAAATRPPRPAERVGLHQAADGAIVVDQP